MKEEIIIKEIIKNKKGLDKFLTDLLRYKIRKQRNKEKRKRGKLKK